MISIDQLPAEKRDEVQRLKAASGRLVSRAQADPAFARQLLEEIGYFRALADSPGTTNGTTSSATNVTSMTAGPVRVAVKRAMPKDKKGKAAPSHASRKKS